MSTTNLSDTKPKIAIVQFPGSNCENESVYAINKAGMLGEEFLWNRSVEDLGDFDGYFIIGGFSYEDRSRSGVISAKDKLMQELIKQAKTGKPILGICNGAQILMESGLVPNLKNQQLGGALAVNKREQNGQILGTGFFSAWCNIKLTNGQSTIKQNAFTRNITDQDIISLPLAHGEGRFVIPEKVLTKMQQNGQLLYQYCDENGNIDDTFPTNPNGSILNLAGIGNPSGNIMAMMPHPERAIDKTEPNARLSIKIFESMRDYILENKSNDYGNFVWEEIDIDIQTKLQKYTPKGEILLVQSVITDKESATINQTLSNLGVLATVSKVSHWEIMLDQSSNQTASQTIQKIIESEELFNPNKENLVNLVNNTDVKNILVRYKDDFVGMEKVITLKHEDIIVDSIKKGILWQIQGDWQGVINSNILANPFGQDIFVVE